MKVSVHDLRNIIHTLPRLAEVRGDTYRKLVYKNGIATPGSPVICNEELDILTFEKVTNDHGITDWHLVIPNKIYPTKKAHNQ